MLLQHFEQDEDHDGELDVALLAKSLESDVAADLASELAIGISATEAAAFAEIIRRRFRSATRSNVSPDLFETLRTIGFPAELLPAQYSAVTGGLLNGGFDSWGFAAPTGSGKTFVARLLIADLLSQNPRAKVLYLVPSRALVYEVSQSLSKSLGKLSLQVRARRAARGPR